MMKHGYYKSAAAAERAAAHIRVTFGADAAQAQRDVNWHHRVAIHGEAAALYLRDRPAFMAALRKTRV